MNYMPALVQLEPFLLRKGYIRKTGRGRVATQRAIDLVGINQGMT